MKRLSILSFLMMMGMCLFTACSDSLDGDSSIKVNGVSCNVDDAGISYLGRIEDSQGEFEIPAHAACHIYFNFDDSMYVFEFSIKGVEHESELIKGQNLIEDLQVNDFRDMYSIEFDNRYYDTAGSVTVKDVVHGYAVLEFQNFSFIKDSGRYEDKYVINGTVKFYDINAD